MLEELKTTIRQDLAAAREKIISMPSEDLKSIWIELLSDPEIKSLISPALLSLDLAQGGQLRDKLITVFLSKPETKKD